MMKRRLTTFITHTAGWLFLFSLIIAFLYRMPPHPDLSFWGSWSFLFFCCFYIFIFYFNYYFLLPEIYLRKKYGIYIAVIGTVFIAVWFLKPFDNLVNILHIRPGTEEFMPPPRDAPPRSRGAEKGQTDIISIILFLAVWAMSTAICIVRQWRLTEKRAIEAETERASAELSFLKAQINPHFLFNTLNNIYAMANMQHKYTADSILKLSNIMRYVTEDVRENVVRLEKELECIQDYIDLQTLRLNHNTDVQFSVTGDIQGKMIEPLLLMTFIENAFKYGASSREATSIIIRVSSLPRKLSFVCINKIFESRIESERTGIGISNARMRLNNQYPDRHSLLIHSEDGFFTVNLTIEI